MVVVYSATPHLLRLSPYYKHQNVRKTRIVCHLLNRLQLLPPPLSTLYGDNTPQPHHALHDRRRAAVPAMGTDPPRPQCDSAGTVHCRRHDRPLTPYTDLSSHHLNPMTYAFTDNAQIDEQEMLWDDLQDEIDSCLWDDDQALEEFCLECCFGPEE